MTLEPTYSPPEIAKSWGVSREKVLNWIRKGDLIAINTTLKDGGRPRYRVKESDLSNFALIRSNAGTKCGPRQKKPRSLPPPEMEFV